MSNVSDSGYEADWIDSLVEPVDEDGDEEYQRRKDIETEDEYTDLD